MSDSISEEIEICNEYTHTYTIYYLWFVIRLLCIHVHTGSQATRVQPDTLSDSYTYRDFESTSVTTSRTTGKENSLDSSTTFQSHHVASTLSLDHSGEHSNVLSNTPSHTEEFPHQCSIQPYNPTGHEFYSKKLAVLKLKTVKDSSTAQSNGCHGNLNTTPSTHPAQDFVIQRLESNGDKLIAPSVNNTPPVSSPAQILMERLPTGQLERLRLEALKHRMSVMIEVQLDSEYCVHFLTQHY